MLLQTFLPKNRSVFKTILLSFVLVFALIGFSRAGSVPIADTIKTDSAGQKDVMDYIHKIIPQKQHPDDQFKAPKKVNLAVVPTLGYSLSTGFVAGVSSISTFFTGTNHSGHQSVINLQALYNSHNQKTFVTQSNIWTNGDNYKIVTDLRINKYPDVTYGLGNVSKSSSADSITYNYIRFYQTFLKKMVTNLYLGAGYCLDYHFGIVEQGVANSRFSAFDRYGKTTFSRSSGFNINALFDNRKNPVYPTGGTYINVFFRDNLKDLGSGTNWQSVQIDARKYFHLSDHNNDVLAIWSYDWLSLGGKQPYFDLPSLGNDTYSNTGRGYPIDRFRGKNMLYLESEYRFGITHNGLLGAVVFANVQTYPRSVLINEKSILPAGGAGLRIKINKNSHTNLAIDYGVGIGGSHGIFANLGEVF